MTDAQDELRLVVDAQIALAMFLARRDQPDVKSPKRGLLMKIATGAGPREIRGIGAAPCCLATMCST